MTSLRLGRWLALTFVASVSAALPVAACGVSDVNLPPTGVAVPEAGLRPVVDGGADVTVGDAPDDAPEPGDAATDADLDAGEDADPRTNDLTVGNTCALDTECERVPPVDKICTLKGFASGSINPTPVCIGVSCLLGSTCDGARGLCVLGGACMPRCAFQSNGVRVACAGKNVCNLHKVEGGGPAPFIGVGYCYRGCRADVDCPVGEGCQVETGECVVAKVAFPKAPGAACTAGEDGVSCRCLTGNGGKGYCASFCVTGEACTPGFHCTANLPAPQFTAEPKGLAGSCLQECGVDGGVNDAECASLGATCKSVVGGKRVCVP